MKQVDFTGNLSQEGNTNTNNDFDYWRRKRNYLCFSQGNVTIL